MMIHEPFTCNYLLICHDIVLIMTNKKFNIERELYLSEILEKTNPNYNNITILKISIENEMISFTMNDITFTGISWDDIDMDSENDLAMAFYYWLENLFDSETRKLETHPHSNAQQFSKEFTMNGNEIKSLMDYLSCAIVMKRL